REQLAWIERYDVFICPISGRGVPLPIDDGLLAVAREAMSGTGVSFTSAFNTNGWPAGVVRAGTTEEAGMPYGVQVAAQPWRDDVVIAALGLIESRTLGFRKPPL